MPKPCTHQGQAGAKSARRWTRRHATLRWGTKLNLANWVNGYALPQLRRQDIRLRQGGSKVRIASASQCCRPSAAGCDLLNECKTVSRLLRQSNQRWGWSPSNFAWRWCTRWMFTYLSSICTSQSGTSGFLPPSITLKMDPTAQEWRRLHCKLSSAATLGEKRLEMSVSYELLVSQATCMR